MAARGNRGRKIGRQLKRNDTHKRYNASRGYVSKSATRRANKRWKPCLERPGRVPKGSCPVHESIRKPIPALKGA